MNDNRASCTCPGGPNDDNDWDACIFGVVYGDCGDPNCGGACEDQGMCACSLHASPTHDSGFGGEYSD